jgi:hypothetical protein
VTRAESDAGLEPEHGQLPSIQVTVDNPEVWAEIALHFATRTGTPLSSDLAALTSLVASGVTLLFEADATGSVDLLRGTFSDQLVAQCERNLGCLHGDRPTSAMVHLVGVPESTREASIRTRVMVAVTELDGQSGMRSQFWDLQADVSVVVGTSTCPNCGAQLQPGQLICGYCSTDVRRSLQVPFVVTKLEMY